MHNLTQGATLKHRFRVKSKIAEGGMGKVFLGEDNITGRKVVIKVPHDISDLPKMGYTNPIPIHQTMVQKLREEAEILRSVSHENIVKFVDFFDHNGVPVLILEYIKGKSLKEMYLNNPGDPQDVLRYGLQIMDAVEYLHGNNILHRDINPKNVIVNNEDRAILIDFGAAKRGFVGGSASKVTRIGTDLYSAPEQISGAAALPQGDVYSIAKTLYFCLAGHDPPPGKIPPILPKSSVSKELLLALSKATEQDPKLRYSSISEFRNAITGIKVAREPYPYLIIQGRKYYLKKDVVTIGRAANADIRIDDVYGYISRIHCVITKQRDNYMLMDNRSTGGIFVYDNGVYRRVDRWWLKDGDIIALCYDARKGAYITFQFKEG